MMNAELARQHADIRRVRERIRAGAVPDSGIDLRRDRGRPREPVPPPPRGRDLGEQHGDHVRAWHRVERARSPAGPRVTDVVEVTCAVWRVLVEDVLGQRQMANVARPRQAAMYLAKLLTTRSWCEIGRAFDRHHSTVMLGFRVVKALVERNDADTIDRLAEVKRRLGL